MGAELGIGDGHRADGALVEGRRPDSADDRVAVAHRLQVKQRRKQQRVTDAFATRRLVDARRPKKPRTIASWQEKPSNFSSRVAKKQVGGWRDIVIAVSLDHHDWNFRRTHSVTSSSSGASARRIVTPVFSMVPQVPGRDQRATD